MSARVEVSYKFLFDGVPFLLFACCRWFRTNFLHLHLRENSNDLERILKDKLRRQPRFFKHFDSF